MGIGDVPTRYSLDRNDDHLLLSNGPDQIPDHRFWCTPEPNQSPHR